MCAGCGFFSGNRANPGPPLPCPAFMSEHCIGVISDTHGLLRPEAVKALKGVELIIHAGDIGDPKILRALERIAPVHAVRGNTDRARLGRGPPSHPGGGGGRRPPLRPPRTLHPGPGPRRRRYQGGHLRPLAFAPPGTPKRRPLPQPRQRRPPAVYVAGESGIAKNCRQFFGT